MARIAGLGMSFGMFPAQGTTISELESFREEGLCEEGLATDAYDARYIYICSFTHTVHTCLNVIYSIYIQYRDDCSGPKARVQFPASFQMHDG